MRSPTVRKLTIILAGLIIVAGVIGATYHVERLRYQPQLDENLYLPSGRFVNEMALGYRNLVADGVWFSAVQYYGEYRQGEHDLNYFTGLIDIVTMLDPHFIFAYVFSALIVSEDIGDIEEAIDILKRGMAVNPTAWELPFEIAFLNFVNRVNYDLAARYFDLASRMPGAPEHVRRFAAFVYSKTERPEAAILLWEQYMEYTDDPYLKELAAGYVERLKTELVSDGVSDDD